MIFTRKILLPAFRVSIIGRSQPMLKKLRNWTLKTFRYTRHSTSARCIRYAHIRASDKYLEQKRHLQIRTSIQPYFCESTWSAVGCDALFEIHRAVATTEVNTKLILGVMRPRIIVRHISTYLPNSTSIQAFIINRCVHPSKITD